MSKLSFVLRLLLAGAVTTVVLSPESAIAQPAAVFEGNGLIEMISATGIVGDGASTAELYVLALNADGSPMSGLSLKASVSTGAVTALSDAGGGLYKLTYTPPNVDARVSAVLTLKGKVGKESVTKAFNFTVSPPRTHAIVATANPPRMTLGQDRTANLSFTLSGGDRAALSGVELAISASSGTIENVTNLGGGQFAALYTAPGVNYPHVAQITIADKRDPSRSFGVLGIPLSGKVEFPVTVQPNNRVVIKIGDQQFGPIQADAQGRARVPILVPPGAAVAEKISISADGKSASEPLDLKVPEGKRITLVPTAAALPSDARLGVPVHAYVVAPDGKPDVAAQVVFSTTAGVVSAAKHVGNGVYAASFQPPNGASSAQATLTASLSDRPSGQTASAPISLVSARATNVALTSEPTVLAAAADGFRIFAKVTGPDGAGLGSRNLTFGASGAKVNGAVKDLKNGDYQAVFTTTSKGPVALTAMASAPVTGNPLSTVLVLPSRARLSNDGLSSSMITVATVDEFGYPVPNVAITLRLTAGDGTLPATATSNAEGVAQVYYTAGRRAGHVAIEATAGDALGAASMVQAPDGLALPTMPASGPKSHVALVNEWDRSLAEMRIEREGQTGAVIAPVVPSANGGARPARAALASDPATVSAGGSVKLRINISDEGGRGVGGQELEFLTSAGTVGAVTEVGGGVYEAMLSVPGNAAGDVKVSVATRDGSVSSFMRVPVGGAESAWTTTSPFTTTETVDPYAMPAPSTTPTPTPVATPAPVAPPVPLTPPKPVATTTTSVTQTPNDRPWLRARAGFSYAWYTYNQQPKSDHTVLFPEELQLSSGSQGGHGQARVFLPFFKYLGAEVDFRGTVYTLDPVPLCAALDNECKDASLVSDTVLATRIVGIGRYAFDVGGNSFHVGARAGWGNSDVQTYTVKEGQEIILDQLALNSLVLGAELGAEVGPSLFFVTTFNEHLAGATAPYNTEFAAEVGYAFLPFLYGSLSYDLSIRSIGIENTDGEPVGAIEDSFHGGTISLGLQL